MRLAYKVLIGLGIAFIVLFGIPATVAAATGKSEALRGLIQTYKFMLKVHIETLEKMLKAYLQFLKTFTIGSHTTLAGGWVFSLSD